MTETIEHVLELAVLCGGMGYLVLMTIIIVAMLRAARRTSDDWDEHLARRVAKGACRCSDVTVL